MARGCARYPLLVAIASEATADSGLGAEIAHPAGGPEAARAWHVALDAGCLATRAGSPGQGIAGPWANRHVSWSATISCGRLNSLISSFSGSRLAARAVFAECLVGCQYRALWAAGCRSAARPIRLLRDLGRGRAARYVILHRNDAIKRLHLIAEPGQGQLVAVRFPDLLRSVAAVDGFNQVFCGGSCWPARGCRPVCAQAPKATTVCASLSFPPFSFFSFFFFFFFLFFFFPFFLLFFFPFLFFLFFVHFFILFFFFSLFFLILYPPAPLRFFFFFFLSFFFFPFFPFFF